MDKIKYERNKEVIASTKRLFEEQGKLLKESKIPEIMLMGLMMTVGLRACIQATKENTEYECKNGTLEKMVSSLKAEG